MFACTSIEMKFKLKKLFTFQQVEIAQRIACAEKDSHLAEIERSETFFLQDGRETEEKINIKKFNLNWSINLQLSMSARLMPEKLTIN